MKENRIALLHMFITSVIGIALMGLLLLSSFKYVPTYKFLILLLFFPISYGTIKLFIATGVRNGFLGFLEGGVFAIIATSIVIAFLGILSSMIFIAPFAFFIGGIAGTIISIEIRKEYKREAL